MCAYDGGQLLYEQLHAFVDPLRTRDGCQHYCVWLTLTRTRLSVRASGCLAVRADHVDLIDLALIGALAVPQVSPGVLLPARFVTLVVGLCSESRQEVQRQSPEESCWELVPTHWVKADS